MASPCVLLISPGIIKWTDLDFGLPHLVALGGYLQASHGVRVEIIDLGYEGGDPAHLERLLDSLAPYLLIGLSCYSSFDLLRVSSLARYLRSRYPEAPLVAGGYHATAMPDELVGEGAPFDAVVVGEGELPLARMVGTLLGGGRLEERVWGPEHVTELDSLPPYRWELLRRYWPRASVIGRKLQVYLSRGCPYRCSFCMERAKGDYAWRPFSPERAVDELARLGSFTKLGRWVVNIADPLFGFRRRWRRQVLTSILERGLKPRQYWTLTRADALEEEDVQLLAKARFSIGIGLETGSPEMLVRMQKTRDPERYLEAIRGLAENSRRHGLNWAANVIVGHPGETPQTLEETRRFVSELVTAASETCGWLSFDPFRLYPGSLVHERLAEHRREDGARFYHPTWWRSWYDAAFRAEHIDPGRQLDFAGRVRFMSEAYAPLVAEVQRRFRGQGRSVDRVFERSIAEQAELLSAHACQRMIARGRAAVADDQRNDRKVAVSFPIGLRVRDPAIRRRESAVRRLLESGTLRSEGIVEALLRTAPERFLSDDEAEAMLYDRAPSVVEGEPPPWVGIRWLALGLEALNPGPGERVADLTATRGYVAAVLAELVGPRGSVTAASSDGRRAARTLRAKLDHLPQVAVVRSKDATVGAGVTGPLDALWLGAALPRFASPLAALLRDSGGAAVTFLGPRFRPQDLTCLVRREDGLHPRILARTRVPVLAGAEGWLVR